MYANSWEKTAEERGFKVYDVVDTKEEAIKIVQTLRKAGVQCSRLHHVRKTIGIDCHVIWINPETLEKPYVRPTRPISDKTDKKVFTCLHCKHWIREGYATIGVCSLTGEETKGTYNRPNCFEWSDRY